MKVQVSDTTMLMRITKARNKIKRNDCFLFLADGFFVSPLYAKSVNDCNWVLL